MKISIIIPLYNEEKLIGETLQSIMNAKADFEQDPNNFLEVIVVDNNSTDKSIDICKNFDVKIVTEKIHNIAKVRNTGAYYATGEVLCFLDADSKVSSNIFTLINERMESETYIGGGTKFKLDKKNLFFKLIYLGSTMCTRIFGLSGVLIYIRKKDFEKLGGFNEKYYAAEDIDFVLKMKTLGKDYNQKYSNIYQGYVITSSRKFQTVKFKDLVLQGGLLLHKSLREDPDMCQQWYNVALCR